MEVVQYKSFWIPWQLVGKRSILIAVLSRRKVLGQQCSIKKSFTTVFPKWPLGKVYSPRQVLHIVSLIRFKRLLKDCTKTEHIKTSFLGWNRTFCKLFMSQCCAGGANSCFMSNIKKFIHLQCFYGIYEFRIYNYRLLNISYMMGLML